MDIEIKRKMFTNMCKKMGGELEDSPKYDTMVCSRTDIIKLKELSTEERSKLPILSNIVFLPKANVSTIGFIEDEKLKSISFTIGKDGLYAHE